METAVMEKRVLLAIAPMPFQQPTVHPKQKHKTYRELLQLDRPKRKVVVVSDDENEDYLEKILRPPPNNPKPPPSNIQPSKNPSLGNNPQLPMPVESGVPEMAVPRKTVSHSSSRNTLRKEIYIDDGSKVHKYNPPFDSAHLMFISSLHRQASGRASMRNRRPLHIQRRMGPQGLVHVLKEERERGGESRRSGAVPLRRQPWGKPEQKRIVDRERLFKDAQQQELFLRSLQ